MIVAGTGHRPDKLYGKTRKIFQKLVLIAEQWLDENKPTKVISGMALGWDLALAQATINKNIPLICAIPCKDQNCKWTLKQQIFYKKILSIVIENPIHKVVYVSDKAYTSKCMQKRNEWMVDHCDVVLAIWDGTMGGTYNCIKYAINKQKLIINLYEEYING